MFGNPNHTNNVCSLHAAALYSILASGFASKYACFPKSTKQRSIGVCNPAGTRVCLDHQCNPMRTEVRGVVPLMKPQACYAQVEKSFRTEA